MLIAPLIATRGAHAQAPPPPSVDLLAKAVATAQSLDHTMAAAEAESLAWVLGSEGPKGATCTSGLAASGTYMTCTALWGLCTNADFKGGFSGRQRR